MKRVVKKTIATVLSSAMMFGTMLSGGVAPVFANVIASDTSTLHLMCWQSRSTMTAVWTIRDFSSCRVESSEKIRMKMQFLLL